MFNHYGGTRYISHSVDLSRSIDQKDPLSNLDSHATVAAKVEGSWYLLDVAMKKPLNITKNATAARKWILNFDYVNVFELRNQKLSPKRSEPLVK